MNWKRILLIIVALFFGLFGKAYYDTNTIEICKYEIKNAGFGEALEGLKVAHLSDLHIKRMDSREKKIIEVLNQEKPDLILLTGDNIGFKGSYEPVLSFFNQLEAPLGAYGVMGNTEYTNESGSCILCHEKGSKNLNKRAVPIILRNSSAILDINGKKLTIVGLDDPVSKKSDLSAALKHLTFGSVPQAASALPLNRGPLEPPTPRFSAPPQNCSTILLSHSPEVYNEAFNQGMDFILAGHNHGGQIYIIKYISNIINIENSLEFIKGFYQQGRTLMYVSRGVGTSFLPFRLGVKAEITFFTFSKAQNGSAAYFQITKHLPIERFSGITLYNLIDLFSFYPLTNCSLLFSSFINNSLCSLRSSLCDAFGTLNYLPLTTNASDKACLAPIGSKKANTLCTTPYTLSLYDFESEKELSKLDWKCHKWFELSQNHATSGKHSLRIELPPGQYPGVTFRDIPKDWSKGKRLRFDVFNPANENVFLHIRIDDKDSGLDYENRFDKKYELKKGMNQVYLPLVSLKTNLNSRVMDLRNIKRFLFWVPENQKKRELFLDYVRLE